MNEHEVRAMALAQVIGHSTSASMTLYEYLLRALHEKGIFSRDEIDKLISDIERDAEQRLTDGEQKSDAEFLQHLIPRLRRSLFGG